MRTLYRCTARNAMGAITFQMDAAAIDKQHAIQLMRDFVAERSTVVPSRVTATPRINGGNTITVLT